jgi:hypothetical protein
MKCGCQKLNMRNTVHSLLIKNAHNTLYIYIHYTYTQICILLLCTCIRKAHASDRFCVHCATAAAIVQVVSIVNCCKACCTTARGQATYKPHSACIHEHKRWCLMIVCCVNTMMPSKQQQQLIIHILAALLLLL